MLHPLFLNVMKHILKGSFIRIIVRTTDGTVIDVRKIHACSASHFRKVVESYVFHYATVRDGCVKCAWLEDGFYIIVVLPQIASYGNKEDK